ncbi:uncharacterized protein EURHEDRAFT_542270, partial [Aspergillus ruber CBS 135680]
CRFEKLSPNDLIFEKSRYLQSNPTNNTIFVGSCVRHVPLSREKPELIEDALNRGSTLIERFCAGILMLTYWQTGTRITDRFTVIDRNSSSIIMRGNL